MIKDLGFFLNCLQENSEEKIKNGIYVTFQTNVGKILLILYFLWLFFLLFIPKFFMAVFLISIIIYFLFLSSNIGAIGITKDNVVIVRVNYFTRKVCEAYEVRVTSFKNVEVKKFLLTNRVKLSFIDNRGKFRNLKMNYSKHVLGKGFKTQKENAEIIYNVLNKEQRIIEKGDF